MGIALAIGFALFCLLCLVLSVIGLPGIWVMLTGALIWQLTDPGVFNWWVIGGCIALGAIAEVVEVAAGAAGAKKVGSSKRAALGAVIGAIVGAIFGTFLIPIPILGTLIGSVLGAGFLAAILEMTLAAEPGMARRDRAAFLYKVGRGASIARFWGALIKLAFAAVVAVVLMADGFV